MTKYIVVGGAEIRNSADGGLALGSEIAAGRHGLKVLSCNFAVAREFWEGVFPVRQAFLKKILDEDTECRLAMPQGFADQIAWADIVYVHGGDNHLLEYYFDQHKNLTDLWRGKTVVASSAGGQYLSYATWSSDWRSVLMRRDILHIKFIPHFGAISPKDDPRGQIDWASAEQALRATGEDMPLHALAEGAYVTFEQD